MTSVLVYYVIRPGAEYQVILMSARLLHLGYNYSSLKLNNYPEIFMDFINFLRFSTCIISRIACAINFRGKYKNNHD